MEENSLRDWQEVAFVVLSCCAQVLLLRTSDGYQGGRGYVEVTETDSDEIQVAL